MKHLLASQYRAGWRSAHRGRGAGRFGRWLLLLIMVCSVVYVLGQRDSSAAAVEEAVQPPEDVLKFLSSQCADCHGGGEAAGGFSLETLQAESQAHAALHGWTRVFDRIERGEMPPPDANALSPAARQAALVPFHDWLAQADRAERKTILRRLNRIEYQNTLHDLLGVSIEVIELLPEDQQAGGFDNNGRALAVSAELMERYLQVARMAIDAAMVSGEQPEVQTWQTSAKSDVANYIPDNFRLVNDHIVMFTSNNTQYSKVSTRAKRIPQRGRYRFEFTAFAHNSREPRVFSLLASNFAGAAAVYVPLGYFEAPPELTRFALEFELDQKFAIQFFLQDFPGWIHGGIKEDSPGIGFSDVTITGPLYDEWPPRSHRQLVGEVHLEQAELADARPIIERFLPRAFRRPVSGPEVEQYLSLLENRLQAGRSFRDSLKITLSAILCSPHFLYLQEAETAQSITDTELASRLSYFLWNSLPDAELLQLAAAGQLSEPPVLRQQVRRLLADSRSQRFVDNFTGQWLRLRDINDTTPDKKLYPEFDELLQYSMVQESRQFFAYLLRENLSIDLFLDADFTLLNGRLARHYDIPDVRGLPLKPVLLPADSPRGGVLTQAAVLKVTANGTNTSPVTRGVWVLENILGQPTPPPPPNIAGIEPDIRGAATIREQLEKHRDLDSCRACHRAIDPPGFALEAFDPVGKYRSHYLRFFVHPQHADKGWGQVKPDAPVDASGELPSGERFAGLQEFKALLKTQDVLFAHCFTEKLLQFGLGREATFSDRAAIHEIIQQAEKPRTEKQQAENQEPGHLRGSIQGAEFRAVQTANEQRRGLRTMIEELVLHPVFRSR